MTTLEAVRSYIDAWNGRSCQAVLESLTPTGTYRDPTTLGPLAGDALRAHLTSLWQSFPDLSFEVVSLAETGDGRAAFEWNMRGTNTGPFRGLPPTGKPVELAGADFVVTDGAKVQAVTGYFDGAAVPRQLGLQVVIQPDRIGPFSFGDSTQVQTGARRMPGAMGITVLHAADEDQAANIRAELAGNPCRYAWDGGVHRRHRRQDWPTHVHDQRLG